MSYSSLSYFKLLTKGNPKIMKGLAKGFVTFILHFAPADLSGFEMCQWRTKGCTAACLNLAGRGGMMKKGAKTNSIQEARKRKTRFFMESRAEFLAMLIIDIQHAINYARRRGLTPVFRLNGTSDVLWELIPVFVPGFGHFANVFEAFPTVQFYDYTKAPMSARRAALAIPNYHLTFSFAETLKSRIDGATWLENGFSASVVFGVKNPADIPTEYLGREVINGDEHDLRFLDPRGVFVGLKAKGYAKNLKNANGFVVSL